MSDASQGPGWWLASDGKWYPPNQATTQTVPQGADPPPQWGAAPTPPPQYAPGTPPKKSKTLRNVLIIVGVFLVLMVGGCVALIAGGTKAVNDELNENEAKTSGGDSAGTREDPLAFGTEVDLGNGWRVTVNSVDLNGDAAVAAANPFNSPAPAGQKYIVVNATAAFGGSGETDTEAPFVGVSWSVFGSGGEEHRTIDSIAVPPDPAFDGTKDLVKGGSTTGNIAFTVNTDETDLVLRVQPVFSLDETEAWVSLEG